METYAKNLNAMNDSLHDLQSDLQRLASQQTQIQQMMQPPQQQQQQQLNPMDPQPFYIASDHPGHHQLHQQHPHPVQRRTWGQPQPIHFAHQQPPPPVRYSGGGAYAHSSTSSPYGGGDPYYSHLQRGASAMFNSSGGSSSSGGSHYDLLQSGMYGPSPSYSPGYHSSSYGGGVGYQAPSQYSAPPSQYVAQQPFRLHDASSPSTAMAGRASFGASPSRQEQAPHMASPLSRQTSRGDSVGVPQINTADVSSGRMHTSIPAPGEDDMAPQNVSFINEKDEQSEKKESPHPPDDQVSLFSS